MAQLDKIMYIYTKGKEKNESVLVLVNKKMSLLSSESKDTLMSHEGLEPSTL
jgi:hypothetical protein